MVCSICNGTVGRPNHNAATCPNLELGVDQMAENVATGVSKAGAVAALSIICPPAGLVVGSCVLAKSVYDTAALAIRSSNCKTQAEKKYVAKQAVQSAMTKGLSLGM